jgi:Tfp pilus assembly protein PilF
VWKDRAIAHFFKKDYDRSLADINECIRLDPKTAHNFAMRAEIYEKKAERELAIADYRQALTLDPSNTYSKAGLARLGGSQ